MSTSDAGKSLARGASNVPLDLQAKKLGAEAGQKAARKAGVSREFVSKSVVEELDRAFRAETVGLVTKEAFVEKQRRIAELVDEENRRAEREARARQEADRERKRKLKEANVGLKSKLSFGDLDQDDDEDDLEADHGTKPPPGGNLPSSRDAWPSSSRPLTIAEKLRLAQERAQAATTCSERGEHEEEPRGTDLIASTSGSPGMAARKRPRVGKDPAVDTSFIMDRERLEAEEDMRRRLEKEWKAEQERIKSEEFTLAFTFYDGSGHKASAKVTKGETVGEFLKKAKDAIHVTHRNLKQASASSLMLVQEDMMIPSDVTFYDLMMKRLKTEGGKKQTMFRFANEEFIEVDVDGRQKVERKATTSYLPKVVDRGWYEKNKHTYPANRWEPYIHSKEYEPGYNRKEGKYVR
jgi:hypothetical protein